MNEETVELLDRFCSPLNFDLRRKVKSEFESRLKEIHWLVSNTDFYSKLENDLEVIELIVLLTVYYKRVIISLDSATKFYTRVSKIKNSEGIQIGKFNYNQEQNNKILGVIISFKKLIDLYLLPPYIFEYIETKDFLRQIITYKESFDYDRN